MQAKMVRYSHMLALWIVLGILGGLILLYFALSGLIIIIAFARRNNYVFCMKYFTFEDYPGLNAKPVHFPTNRRRLLRGYIYQYPLPEGTKNYRGVITFVHGVGAGHEAYTSVIEWFCAQHYIVFAYDQMGCGYSDGRATWSLVQGLVDLKHATKFLAGQKELEPYTHYLIGHSWGGYVSHCSHALKLEINYQKSVGISGFNKFSKEIASMAKGLSIFEPGVNFFDYLRFPKLTNVTAKKSLGDTTKEVLVIHGEKDSIVPYKKNFTYLQNALKDRPNIHFLPVPERNHQPYLTPEGEHIVMQQVVPITVFGYLNHHHRLDKAMKERCFLVDWKKATSLNGELMHTIVEFLEKEKASWKSFFVF